MNCDPNALADAARCFDCLPPKVLTDTATYLMCQWVGALGPVVNNLLIADDGTFIITDDGNFILIHS
jgi:hypothetical protein